MPGLHAPLAPSAAHRWRNCPGSVALAANYPNESSAFAEEGTMLHDVIAGLINRGARPADVASCHCFADPKYDGQRDEYEDLMRSCLAVFYDRLDEDDVVLIEQPLRMPNISDVWGTADVVLVGATRIETIDWKFGRGVEVQAIDNEQLEIYLLMAAMEYGFLADVRVLIGTIYQPRLGPPKEWSFGPEEIAARYQNINDAAIRTLNDTTLQDGEWCQFCPAKAGCPKLTATAMAAARQSFEPIVLAKYDGSQIGKAMDVIPRLQQWIAAIQGEALTRLKSGAHVPGYKIVEGKRVREMTDPERAERWTRRMLGDKGFTTPTMLSLAQLEKTCKAQKIPMPPEGSFWDWRKGAEHVALETDSREAVAPNALMFDTIDADMPHGGY